jgi:hypothetical protein
VIIIRYLAALAAVMGLAAGNVAVCAGWQPTPEARMACCLTGTSCPMHDSDGHGHDSTGGGLSQTQADRCCAASAERRESPSAASLFASSGAIALVPTDMIFVPATVPAAQEWRELVPLRASSVQKHLLLSVLLV